ncbi:ribosome production factor 1-like, partial [Rosa chinensis]|uniref:ribosome production factor 1-like n=1 Tax=Rosa chinensis TaxID=74649 RepID=UPI001AD90854
KKDEIYGGRLLASLQLFVRNDADEFSAVFKRGSNPKILITTCRFNSSRGPAFIEELLSVIPNAQYYKRGTYDLKKIIEYANKKEFTSLIVVHTNRWEPDALLIIGLPNGHTTHFKLSKLVLRKDIKGVLTVIFFPYSLFGMPAESWKSNQS